MGSGRVRGAVGRRKAELVAKTGWCLAVCLAVGGGGQERGHGLKFGKHLCTAHLNVLGGKRGKGMTSLIKNGSR